ncbi:YihY family inner membrane protein [Undibacterium sp. Ji22W]|uniref:YihY family inner membrane protein n=1 Tax=Undibacterium sp. Ji22W TaxID=3413038 RepID=UPI003BF34514
MRGLSWPQIKNLIQFALRRLQEVRLPQVAGSLTFTTVLALVPILTIGLAILTAFPLFTDFKVSLEAYFTQSLMPKQISTTVMGYLTQFATKATRLSAVGGVVLMFTAVATMAMIDKTFNQIWQVKRSRPLVQRIVVYWAIVTLGPLLIGISMSATSSLFTATNGLMKTVPLIGTIFYTAVSIAFTTGAYTLLYLTVPNRPVDWRDAAWGGVFAAVAFEIAKRLFAIFIKQFPTYTVIYGALAAVPIFLIWIYLSWLITLVGAVIAASLPVVKFERWWHVPEPGSAFEDAMAVLRILIMARNSDANAVVDVLQVRKHTRFGVDEIEGLLEKMLEAGWVARLTNDGPARKRSWWHKHDAGSERWVLIMNPAAFTLADVYRLFVFDTKANSPLAKQVHRVIGNGMSESLFDHFLLR